VSNKWNLFSIDRNASTVRNRTQQLDAHMEYVVRVFISHVVMRMDAWLNSMVSLKHSVPIISLYRRFHPVHAWSVPFASSRRRRMMKSYGHPVVESKSSTAVVFR